MKIAHTCDAKQGVSSSEMASFDCGGLRSEMLMFRRQFERREGCHLASLLVPGLEYDCGGEPFLRLLLQPGQALFNRRSSEQIPWYIPAYPTSASDNARRAC